MLAQEAMAYAQDAPIAEFRSNSRRQSHGIDPSRRYSTGKPADHFQTVALSIIRAHQPVRTYSPPLHSSKVVDNMPSAERPEIAGAFEDVWHWQNLFLDLAPFRYLAQKYAPTSVLDIGCGNGLYLHLLQEEGVKNIFGVDGIDHSATVLNTDTYAKVDLQSPYSAGRRFDAVFCLEVVEHIHPKNTEVLFDTIAAHAKDLIIFSMAEPGQPGNGHINCRMIPEVLDLWKSRGFAPDLIETLGVRALSTTSWFRRNILVLKPIGAGHTDAASEALRKISAMDYIWYAQPPGIRQAAFQERFPSAKRGYGKVIV
jgi:2-polyprenyl-3-methyl-5-hydroxy-6-metoxy-1,4-benzoquinol methylase